jgi:hypothetical protein
VRIITREDEELRCCAVVVAVVVFFFPAFILTCRFREAWYTGG